jgi:hypothetical protein
LRDRLPAEVASHYGADGVDATQSLTAYLVSSGAVLAVITVMLAALTLAMPGDARRVLGATQLMLSAVLGMTLYGSLVGQLGLADARRAPLPGPWLAAGLGLGAPLAVLGWRLLRPTTAPRPAVRDRLPANGPLRTDPARGSDLAWSGRTPWSAGASVVVALVVALAVIFTVAIDPWVGLIPAIVGVSLVGMLRGRVGIDADGVRVRSFGRLTWVHIPVEQVRFADADTISPLRDFGGYGLRYGLRGRGFVTRAGEALRAECHDGPATWVTVEGAAAAAEALNALVARLPETAAGPTP